MEVEKQLLETFVTENHIGLLIGVYGVLWLLKSIDPIKERLFAPKWKWIIPILNTGLSFSGVFVLGLTDFTTVGMQIILALFISALATYTHESLGKYIIERATEKVKEKVKTKMGKK